MKTKDLVRSLAVNRLIEGVGKVVGRWRKGKQIWKWKREVCIYANWVRLFRFRGEVFEIKRRRTKIQGKTEDPILQRTLYEERERREAGKVIVCVYQLRVSEKGEVSHL